VEILIGRCLGEFGVESFHLVAQTHHVPLGSYPLRSMRPLAGTGKVRKRGFQDPRTKDNPLNPANSHDVTDPFFGPAFIDIDEWRDAPVRHRYVHGGFEGTDTRFSVYFPPPEQYGGRFLQPPEGGNGGHETTAQGGLGTTAGIAFAFSRA